MKLGYVIIYTSDVKKSVEFYTNVFGLKCRFEHDEGQYAEMETGDTALAFVSNELAGNNLDDVSYHLNEPGGKPAGIELAFVVDDVAGAYQHAVTQGAAAVKRPAEKPWGQVVGYVRDNNGVLIELASPMG